MRKFYLIFPKRDALRPELSWTHYRILMRVENNDARRFYMQESEDKKEEMQPSHIIKDPHVLEFLDMKANPNFM